ncbi:MAG: hypothetical protein AAF589_08745 [Planctomycetota bacterium]
MRSMLAVMAAALLASSVGCQTMKSGACEDPCHISLSQNAPRPQVTRPACGPPGCNQCGYESCGCETGACGCEAGGCGCGTGCGGFGCLSNQSNGCVNGLVNGVLGGPSCCPLGPGDSVYDFQPGPPTGATAYPYYTTRGPRDFLMANPPSIGPGGAYGCR